MTRMGMVEHTGSQCLDNQQTQLRKVIPHYEKKCDNRDMSENKVQQTSNTLHQVCMEKEHLVNVLGKLK